MIFKKCRQKRASQKVENCPKKKNPLSAQIFRYFPYKSRKKIKIIWFSNVQLQTAKS